MGDTVAINYIYPHDMLTPAWALRGGARRVIVQLTGVSDGTGEAAVVKVDLSELKTHSGAVPTKTAVEWIRWHATGGTYALSWDRAPDVEIYRINANAQISDGDVDWTQSGGRIDAASGAGTGDILLTSTNMDAGDTYNIIVCARLKD